MKRVEPDERAEIPTIIEQLKAYSDAEGVPQHHWSRRWMGIAARALARLDAKIRVDAITIETVRGQRDDAMERVDDLMLALASAGMSIEEVK